MNKPMELTIQKIPKLLSQSGHLIAPNSFHWLGGNKEHGARTGIQKKDLFPAASLIWNYHIYWPDNHPDLKADLPLQLERCTAPMLTYPPLVSIEATAICIPIGNKEILFAALYKPPDRAWSKSVVIGLLNFKNKSRLAGNLSAKNPVWNSQVSNLSGMIQLNLQDKKDFKISAPQFPTHYCARRWRYARYCGATEYLLVRCHRLWHPRVGTSVNPILHPEQL
jgi:hypothetical protein